jgi:tetratricopeptide (TPR) repeat protein
VQLSDIYLETKRYQQAADWLKEVIAIQERYQIATRGAEGLHDAISALTSFGNCYAALAQSSGLRSQLETAIASWQKAKRLPKVGPEDLAALDRKIETARQQLASAH